MPEWTREQKMAIESRDGTILVSAAAGSGKTAVLVERVIRRLMDTENPCSVDRLLIVTFTRAATQQMKDRIFSAISDKLREDPGNSYLKKQLLLLPFAHISTIDSFCNDIVRENFHELDISPDYRMLEGAELKIIENDSLSQLSDELYKENSPEFLMLADLLVGSTGDENLNNLIKSLYNNSMAFARPDDWLDSLLSEYNVDVQLKESRWGNRIVSNAVEAVQYCLCISAKMFEKLDSDSVLKENYEKNVAEIDGILHNLEKVIAKENWDTIRAVLNSVKFSNLGRLPKGYKSPEADFIKAQKSNIRDILKKTASDFCASESENSEDMKRLKPAAEKIISIVRRYREIITENKRSINGVDFSDITHMALNLLISYDEDGNAHKTELAKSMSEEFDEILVDEYQDINEIQNALFSAVSKNDNNIFMVGDVKQSIYRFRQAMPEIFLSRRDSIPDFDGNNYPARITLGKNFRSRAGVTENINYVFSKVMSKEMGGIEYNDNEKLVAAADYNQADYPQTELHIIGELESGERVSRRIEAQHIADVINKYIEDKIQVKDKNKYRNVTYRDFCILMRATGGGKAEIYADILTKNNIPVYISSKTGFFEAAEVSTILNLMRVVDNPIQDIPLLSVMFSPLFGFTPDELSEMRIEERRKPIYHCILNSALKGNQKSKAFLEKFEQMRVLASTLTCTQFVSELFDATGYKAIVSAMSNGSARRANLNMLLDYASKYEEAGHRGLSGFIRFIDKIASQNNTLDSASDVSEAADVVRIMTIHKSKGLEFPFCILADLNSKFNNDSKTGVASFHSEYGICFDINDNVRKVQYTTVGKTAIKIAEGISGLSEELRVLYVAMTRAKERLIIMTRYDKISDKISNLGSGVSFKEPVPPFLIRQCSCMADWILLSFLRYLTFLNQNGFKKGEIVKLDNDEDLDIKIINSVEICDDELTQEKVFCPNDELLEEIKYRLDYRYPYSSLMKVRAKSAPSEFDKGGFNAKYFACAKPQFLSKSGMNSASRGTAVHKFMEFFDYMSDDTSISGQSQRMINENRLTVDEANVLEENKLKKFFESDIALRIRKSNNLMREKKVTVGIAAGELYPNLSDDEKDETVIIQGYVDCAFEENGKIVIVDYKTDRGVTMEELRERYSTQLMLYERALSECSGKEIAETLIYSFENGTYISLKKR